MSLLRQGKGNKTGRIARPADYPIGAGDWLMSLGPDPSAALPVVGVEFELDSVTYIEEFGWVAGDFYTIAQNVDLTSLDEIVYQVIGQAPSAPLPSNLVWRLGVFIDSNIFYFRDFVDNREITIKDSTIPVKMLSGVKSLSFGLTLIDTTSISAFPLPVSFAYQCNDNTSNTQVTESSPNFRHGVASVNTESISTADGLFNRALIVSGSENIILDDLIGELLSTKNTWYLSLWFKPENTNTEALISSMNSSYQGLSVCKKSTGTCRIEFRNAPDYYYWETNNTYIIDVWNHLLITLNKDIGLSSLRLFLNGVENGGQGPFDNHPTLTTNLLFYGACEDDTTNTIMTDSTSNGNAVLNVNSSLVSTTSGVNNNGFDLSGGNRFATISRLASSIDYDKAFSGGIWFYGNSGSRMLFGNTFSSSVAGISLYVGGDGKLRFFAATSSGNFVQITSNEILSSEWNFASFRYDGNGNTNGFATGAELRLNNVINNSISISGFQNSFAPSTVYIGRISASYDPGIIDEIPFANREWTDDEMNDLWNNGDGLFYGTPVSTTADYNFRSILALFENLSGYIADNYTGLLDQLLIGEEYATVSDALAIYTNQPPYSVMNTFPTIDALTRGSIASYPLNDNANNTNVQDTLNNIVGTASVNTDVLASSGILAGSFEFTAGVVANIELPIEMSPGDAFQIGKRFAITLVIEPESISAGITQGFFGNSTSLSVKGLRFILNENLLQINIVQDASNYHYILTDNIAFPVAGVPYIAHIEYGGGDIKTDWTITVDESALAYSELATSGTVLDCSMSTIYIGSFTADAVADRFGGKLELIHFHKRLLTTGDKTNLSNDSKGLILQ